MQVARYWRNRKLLYQLRRNRVLSVRASAEAPDKKTTTRREKETIKVVVA